MPIKKMGRPTDELKSIRLDVRISNAQIEAVFSWWVGLYASVRYYCQITQTGLGIATSQIFCATDPFLSDKKTRFPEFW